MHVGSSKIPLEEIGDAHLLQTIFLEAFDELYVETSLYQREREREIFFFFQRTNIPHDGPKLNPFFMLWLCVVTRDIRETRSKGDEGNNQNHRFNA